MNQGFLDTMYLFSCASKGTIPNLDHMIDIGTIHRIAQDQGIWNCVFLSVSKLYKSGQINLNNDIYQKWYNEYVVTTSMNFRKNTFVHNIIKKLNQEGIDTCILKGESVASHYANSESRISSDTDILINPTQINKCLKILEMSGFTVGELGPGSHQIECHHPIGGLVEVHIKMYGDYTNEICFNKEITYNEEYAEFTAEDGTILKTLGATDNAMFLFMHIIKHILWSGIGIRQINDFLLFIEANYNNINWRKFNNTIEKLGFKKFFECIINIGKLYFQLNKNLFDFYNIDGNLLEKIISDIELGGVFGFDDKSRKGFYNLYLSERYKKFHSDTYTSYMNKKRLKRLFPNRKYMSVNFPYLNKTILLLPIAWIHRIILWLFKSKKAPINPVHTERLNFLKELDMV